jgi:signal transduction histidine kinase
MGRGRRWFWVLAFVVFSAGAVFFCGYHVFEDRAAGLLDTAPRRLLEEAVGAYTALALLPAVGWLVRRHPLERGRLRRSLPVHLAGLLAYSAAHTFLLALAHSFLFPVLGFPADPYLPKLVVRALQELAHDAIGYSVFVALVAAWKAGEALRETELRALRLQLQPHFLFNALNTIAEAIHEDPRAAEAMLDHLAELLRLALRTGATEEVPLADELTALRRYLALVDARFGDRLRVVLDVPADTEPLLVPSLLLQPLVENALRHGMTGQRLEVAVSARRAGGALILEVADDGPGADPGADVLGKGLGLATTAGRLRHLHGRHGHLEAGNRDGGGFAVRVRLPARTGP